MYGISLIKGFTCVSNHSLEGFASKGLTCMHIATKGSDMYEK